MLKERVNSRKKAINVILFSKYKLLNEGIRLLLESKSEIKIQHLTIMQSELFKTVSQSKPDVVLFYLPDDENENIKILPKLLKLSPATKVLVLTNMNSSLDQKAIIKSGVTGIVGTNQKEENLIRAIRQVSEGGVWFSQKLISQLLDNENDRNGSNGQNGSVKYQHLTDREYEVIESIALGLSNKDISKKLLISEATVRHHLSSIYSKLYVEDRLNLVIYAYQNDIVRRSENGDSG